MSIFSRIISGEIPSYMIYQDEYVACFLDAFPLALGHILVVPTIEVDHFYDVPEPYSTAVHNASKKVAIALKQATDATRIGMIVEGFQVPHCHYHLIPIMQPGDLNRSVKQSYTPEQMQDICDRIKKYI